MNDSIYITCSMIVLFERFSGYNPHPATVLFARGINYRIYMG